MIPNWRDPISPGGMLTNPWTASLPEIMAEPPGVTEARPAGATGILPFTEAVRLPVTVTVWLICVATVVVLASVEVGRSWSSPSLVMTLLTTYQACGTQMTGTGQQMGAGPESDGRAEVAPAGGGAVRAG